MKGVFKIKKTSYHEEGLTKEKVQNEPTVEYQVTGQED